MDNSFLVPNTMCTLAHHSHVQGNLVNGNLLIAHMGSFSLTINVLSIKEILFVWTGFTEEQVLQ